MIQLNKESGKMEEITLLNLYLNKTKTPHGRLFERTAIRHLTNGFCMGIIFSLLAYLFIVTVV
ncbi:MAG: hypothetical protein KKF44_03100 [Nanoarchaeota archaeon]|nr:hypothetical protein [Nanoarchaeota archaeon]